MSPPHDSGGAPREPAADETETACQQVTDRDQRNRRAHVELLRRRRTAALRCPPLADGRRDPLDEAGQEVWSAGERAAWRNAIGHLRALGYDVGPAVAGYMQRSARRVAS